LAANDVPQPANVTVNQLNVGQMDAPEVARRVAFLLAKIANAPAPTEPATIDGNAVRSE
jgi:hypothetical protein